MHFSLFPLKDKMTVHTLPFVSVQADWEDVVREVASNTIPEGSFWIACYLTGLL